MDWNCQSIGGKIPKKGGKYEIVIITNLRNLKLGQGDELEKFGA